MAGSVDILWCMEFKLTVLSSITYRTPTYAYTPQNPTLLLSTSHSQQTETAKEEDPTRNWTAALGLGLTLTLILVATVLFTYRPASASVIKGFGGRSGKTVRIPAWRMVLLLPPPTDKQTNKQT